jgi:colicin import membrane protein
LCARSGRIGSIMSTVPDRRAKFTKASFAYGYREVREKLPNGRYRWVRMPLTLMDVLHPQFGDVHVLSDPHAEDCTYLRTVLKDRHAGNPSAVVLSDCGIFWDVPRLKHHSPDLSVIFGVKRQKEWITFHVKIERVRPSLIIEVTSPKTRVVDIKTKVKQYARAKVPYYVIADASFREKRRVLTLIAYRLEGSAYKRVESDEHGRVWLEPVGLWLGVRKNPATGGDRVVLIDPATDEEIGDYTAINQARAAEAQRADAEAQARAAEAKRADTEARARAAEARRADTEARARAAEAKRADAEAQARADAEARVRELEAELKRLKGRRSR